jgi:alpha/beta superfamily hydrolase
VDEFEVLVLSLRSRLESHGTTRFFRALAKALRAVGRSQGRFREGARELFGHAAHVMETTEKMLAIQPRTTTTPGLFSEQS